MRCSEGDLARVINIPLLAGYIVVCNKSYPPGYSRHWLETDGPLWETDKIFSLATGFMTSLMPDKNLEPLPPLSEEETKEFLDDMVALEEMKQSPAEAILDNIRNVQARIEQAILKNRRKTKK